MDISSPFYHLMLLKMCIFALLLWNETYSTVTLTREFSVERGGQSLVGVS